MAEGTDGSHDGAPVRGHSAPPTAQQAASDSLLIFISYRRDDTAGYAGRLYDSLSLRFRPEQLFMDVDTIELGVDFVEVIEEAVGRCDVLLALIGPDWLNAADSTGSRRLDNPNDFVRLEVESALGRGIRVIPVLLDRARMPNAEDLPATMQPLVRRNALEVTHGRWRADVERLVGALTDIEREKKAGVEATALQPLAAAEAESASERLEAEAARAAEQREKAETASVAEQREKAEAARVAEQREKAEAARAADQRRQTHGREAGTDDAGVRSRRRLPWGVGELPVAPAVVGAGGVAILLVAGVLAAAAMSSASGTPTPGNSATAAGFVATGTPSRTTAPTSEPTMSATPSTRVSPSAAVTADGCIAPPADRPIVYWRFGADPNEGEAFRLDPITAQSAPLFGGADEFYDSFPALSPAGDTFAVGRREAGGRREIWTLDESGSGANLTGHDADDWYPSWAPGGGWLAFASGRNDSGGIYAIHSSSGEVLVIDDPASIDRAPDWSPTGSAIAYWSDRAGSPDLYVVDVEGEDGDAPLVVGDPRRLTEDPDAELVPSWSPDGSKLLFAYGPNTTRDVYVLDVATGTSTPLIETPDVREDSPAWSPDGRLITFFRGTPEDYAIWIANADGSCERQLTEGGRNDVDPRWR